MIRDLLETNRKHSTRAIATEINLPKSNAWCIITEKLLMRKVCSTWVPHSMIHINKQSRVECCQRIVALVDSYDMNDLAKFWATEDETWVLFQSSGTKEENKNWLYCGEARRPN